MAPLEGKIVPAGSGSHPTAPRVPIPGASDPPRFRSEDVPPAAPPASLPAASAQPSADPIEEIKARAAAHAEERRARAAERAAAAAERKAALREREKAVQEREATLKTIEERLQSYRLNPHLALEDLRQYGVSFEQLAQAVVDGRASPEQLAAAEAARARREIGELKASLDERERASRAAEAQRRTQAEREAAAEAVNAFKSELRAAAEKDAAKYPLISRTLEKGVLDHAFEIADRMFADLRRTPTPEEVLGTTEQQLERDFADFADAMPGRGAAPSRVRSGPAPAPSGSAAQDRRAWFLRMLDEKLKGLR